MAYGMTNAGGLTAYKANQALTLAREAKEAVQAGGVPLDTNSAVAFSLGCDNNGVYMVTPDENEEEGVAE